MIWLKQEERLSWSLISVVIFSTLFLVGFDLVWRFVSMSFFQLVSIGFAVWLLGVLIILVAAHFLKKRAV